MLARFIPRGCLNNSFNTNLNEKSQSMKIHLVIDTEKLLGVDNLDKFINNTSF